MKVYIAGPLFNDMERERNVELKRFLEQLGLDVYLPQEHGSLLQTLAAGQDRGTARARIFEADVAALGECDAIVCLLDGRVPDEGMCVELGMAYALDKPCIGYKTDHRRHDETGDNNLMIDGCLQGRLARSLAELGELLRRLPR